MQNFFDDLDPRLGGNKSKRIPLNESIYSQVRRLHWSVVLAEYRNDAGQLVRKMLSYGKANSRVRSVLHATPMPSPVSDLVHHCYMTVRHELSSPCQSSAPNHVALLAYYGAFESAMTRHKDDHLLADFHRMLFKRISREDATMRSKGTAQVAGSDVLILSFGSMDMLFSFCFAHKDHRFAPMSEHRVHHTYQRLLTNRTLLVFKAVDDLHFYHTVTVAPFQPHSRPSYPDSTPSHSSSRRCAGKPSSGMDPSLHRFAICMRWLDPALCAKEFLV